MCDCLGCQPITYLAYNNKINVLLLFKQVSNFCDRYLTTIINIKIKQIFMIAAICHTTGHFCYYIIVHLINYIMTEILFCQIIKHMYDFLDGFTKLIKT